MNQDQFTEGRIAQRQGCARGACPFPANSKAAHQWRAGWASAKYEASAGRLLSLPPGTTPTEGFIPWHEQSKNDEEKLLAQQRDDELKYCEKAVHLFAVYAATQAKTRETITLLMGNVNHILKAFGVQPEDRWGWFGQAMSDYLVEEARIAKK